MAAKPHRSTRVAANPLPCSPDIEKLILGVILIEPEKFPEVCQTLAPEDFSLELHRKVLTAMTSLQAAGEAIDRVTVANELQRQGDLEGIGGLSYLITLDNDVPQKINLTSYLAIIKEKSRLRKLVRAARDTYNAAVAGDALSADVIAKSQAALTEIGDTLDTKGQLISEFIEAFPGGPAALIDPTNAEKGIPTGFTRLDEWTSGIHPGEIFTIGARPGQGKTALGLNILSNIAKDDGFCVFFSLEMSKRSCINRLICANARVDVNRFRSGYLNEDDKIRLRSGARIVNQMSIYIDDSSGLKVSDISMRLQALCREQPVSLFLIDYFQLLRPAKGKRYGTENEMFTEIAHDLQLLCKTTRIPMLLLSQLNRDSEKATGDKRPKLSQCRGAGAIEEISNVGACIYRESVYKRDREDLRGMALLLVDKNREGPSGEIKLVYLDYLTKFENPADDY